MAVQNLEITTESILGAVVRLPNNEVDKLFKDAKRLKKREVDLIKKVTELIYLKKNKKNTENF